MLIIKELLKHIYPSSKALVYYREDCEVTTVGDLYNVIGEDEICKDWAVYKDHLSIFL